MPALRSPRAPGAAGRGWTRARGRAAETLARLLAVAQRRRRLWRRLAGVLAWTLAMAASVAVHDGLARLDWRVLAALDRQPAAWPGRLAVLDLGWDRNPATKAALRARLAAALDALAALDTPPRIVVVDVAISAEPVGLEALRAAIGRLRARDVDIVQVTDLTMFPPGIAPRQAWEYQARSALYGSGDARYGHARFSHERGSAWYDPCVVVGDGSERDEVPAVPLLVAMLVERSLSFQCPVDGRPVVIKPGADRRAAADVRRWGDDRAPGAADGPLRALAGRVVVVGNVDHDRVGDWSGPLLLARAIGAAIATPGERGATLLHDPRHALAPIVGGSLATLALFALLRPAFPRGRWLGACALAAAFGGVVVVAAAVLALAELRILAFQVGHALVGIAATAALAWHASAADLRRRALYSDVASPEAGVAPRWDVFVSYSHTPAANIERVRRLVVEPLSALATTDGPLRVFFDERAIRIGCSWYFELAEGIERSRCFVAVYGGDYFAKNFCRFELQKAVVRDIAAQGRGFRVLPFRLDAAAEPPPEFRHLQYRVPADASEIVAAVRAALREQGVDAG